MVVKPTRVLLDDVIDEIGATGTLPIALDGGITNHNFRVGDVVVRLPGAGTEVLGIDRVAERAATEAAAAVGVGPQVVGFVQGCLITRFIEGEPLDVRTRLAEVAAALRGVHTCPPIPSQFSGFRICEAYAKSAETMPPEFARNLASRIEAALTDPEHDPVPCHNDLLPANFLWDGRRVRIVDWEYAGMGDRYFDLGNLAVNNGFDAGEETALLDAYFGEATPRRLAALRLQRLMSDFREAMWGVLQAKVSQLDFDFEAYADEHFARLKATVERSPVEEWLRVAAG
jgi:aminoglycoside phosphotransferase (APT) family kinase protein